MPRKRIPSSDRRAAILAAARRVFAERGYEGAKTQHIATAAGVSDALIFRHFGSKQRLYRAVMQDLVREQDASFKANSLPSAGTESLLQAIWDYLESCVYSSERAAETNRILIANLASDGAYARFVFRRARRLVDQPVRRAFDTARATGDIGQAATDPLNGSLFVAHVGEIISLSRSSAAAVIPYRGGDAALVRDAFRFCVRGLGVVDEAIERFERTRRDAGSRTRRPTAAKPRRVRANRAAADAGPKRPAPAAASSS